MKNQCFYELDKESPFYQYMLNREVEDSLSEEEKIEIFNLVQNNLTIWSFEKLLYSEHEKNFFIYAFLNDLDQDEMTKILFSTKDIGM